MVVYYAIAGIALALFYTGYGTGFARGRDEGPNPRGIGLMLIGGLSCAILWAAAVEGIRAPGAGAVILLFIAGFGALFVFGLGRLIGSHVLFRFDEGPRRLAAVVLTMGLPAAIVGWTLYGVTSAEAALQARNTAAREALQAGTYSARFAAHDITVPGAPVLSLVHPCRHRPSRCTTMFWTSPGWNNRAEGPLELFAVDVVTHPGTLEAQVEWCARRPDMPLESVWCTLEEQDNIRFRPADELRGDDADRTLRCRAVHTGQVDCKLTDDVAPGVVALLSSLAQDEPAARAALLVKRNRAEALWASLTAVPRP